ncbi:MAG: GNAT family N-acetyltransferase [Actinomycetota bacterium]|nr:GNAT family N-acetyltransferase [Actinomycetota bacterium]
MQTYPGATRARLATPSDAAELVRLRALMFDSVGVDTSDPLWRDACLAHLQANLGGASLLGAVVDAPGDTGLAAGGLADILARPPGPSLPSGRSGYLGSISTDPRFQRRGYARAVMVLLLDELRSAGVDRVELHATPAGEPLYRSLGFAERRGGLEMRLVLGRSGD